MSSFADSFWTQDYNSGFKVLFEQLHQGASENEDFINLFSKRMESELIYGTQLMSIQETKPSTKRYSNDDYVSSVKNAYIKMNENFTKQGEYHLQIASNIKLLVLQPFSKWCKEHKQRVDYSESVITDDHKIFTQGKSNVTKLQKKYFNKCRMLEEFKSHYTEEELSDELRDLEFAQKQQHQKQKHSRSHSSKPPTNNSDDDISNSTSLNNGTQDNSGNNDNEDPNNDNNNNEIAQQDDNDEDAEFKNKTYQFGNATFDHKTLKQLLIDILSHIDRSDHKVAILGTYTNVSTGSAITQWLLDNMPEFNGNIVKAETFGQDLVNNGLIRLIGSMSGGKNFINSSQFYYQWKPLAFEITKLPIHNQSVTSSPNADDEDASENGLSRNASLIKSNNFADYFEDMKQAIGVNSIDYNDKTQLSKIIQEVNQLDRQYLRATIELDRLRCQFEELIMDHLSFMQKCELDRLKAIKKVTFDFLASFGNKVTSMKSMCDELLILEETINPLSDLKFLIENYGTGFFKPHVILYDNYYNSNIKQTFGVSLNVKSRLDHKVVPIMIQCILSHLDSIYPDIANDAERVNLWTQPVHLTSIHQLRFKLNDLNDVQKINQVLASSHPLIVTNVLKLYFMELPDAIIPYNYYDLIKSLYQNYPVNTSDESVDLARLNGLQNVLVDLPKCSLATLDALLTHLNRLIQIIGSKDESLASDFRSKLAKEFGNIILRPKVDHNMYSTLPGSSGSNNAATNASGGNGGDGIGGGNSGFISEKHQTVFINDLFEHKDWLFRELRRRNSSRNDGLSSQSSSLRRASKASTSRRGQPSSSPDPNSPAASSASVADQAKSRLNAKMKRAVTKSKISPRSVASTDTDSVPSSSPSTHRSHTDRDAVEDDDEILVADDELLTSEDRSSLSSNKSPVKETLAEAVSTHSTPKIKRTSSTVLPEPPATPPPHSPTKKSPAAGSLKRSSSPNKKKAASTNLHDVTSSASSTSSTVSTSSQKQQSSKASVVSSRPLKRDIIYSAGNNSENSSPNNSAQDITQPKFASSIGRKTSVKDMASRFDSPSPPAVPAKDSDSAKSKNYGKSDDDAIVVE